MQLNIEQKKLIQAKPAGHSLIKGVAGSGKTTVAVNRIPFLLNNYCFASDDRILMVTYNKTLINYIKYVYEKVQDENKVEYLTLFAPDSSKVEIYTIDKIIYEYFKEYKTKNNLKYQVIQNNNEKYSILAQCIAEIKKLYPKVSILDTRNISFLIDEIEWIKSCNYMELEEYQNVDRLGRMGKSKGEGPQKLLKNSNVRRSIFELMLLYNKKLQEAGYIDFKDMALIALKEVIKNPKKKYTHILVDESQDLTRTQLEFLKALHLEKEYSSFLFVADTAQSIYPHSWLVKGRSFTSIGLDMTGKSSILCKNYRTTTQIAQAAYSLIENDPNIIEDDNFVKPSLIDKQGSYPIYKHFKNAKDEASFICKEIKDLINNNYNYKDIAVVGKSKNVLKLIQEYLNNENIPTVLLDKNSDGFEEEKVKLLTMHSIKGLEFKIVMIISVNEGVIPFISYTDNEDISFQESIERKLLYVGMTRANDFLYITSSGTPSRFLKDINPKYLRINKECRISRVYNISPENFLFKNKLMDMYSHEEKIRQWILKELVEEYKYPLELIDIEYKVNNFSRVGSVDICVQIYNKTTKIPYIFIETKAYGCPLHNGLSQLQSYMSSCKTCQYGIVTNGGQCIIIDKDFNIINDISAFDTRMLPSSVENYKFIDVKHNKTFSILKDLEVKEEMLVKGENGDIQYGEEDLMNINMYSNIAAGIPIYMNPECKGSFYLPKEWFNSMENYFILTVKGDSMKDADILDGDLVVIKQQPTADNRDIVAAAIENENATLKRFMKMGDTILLIPENENYEPIQIKSNQAKILGVAVGVIKKM